ncbi:MAG: AsmA family protein [Rickettsiales bacterium]|jgi:uncharacterized protein involved in outer membrane biogenesis|nr:AsmA family protein [Rickettsiales bacterium]
MKKSEKKFSAWRLIKNLIRLTCFIMLAAVVGLGVALHELDPNEYKDDIARRLSKALGREVKINGGLNWQILTKDPGLAIERLSIKNAPWGEREYFLEAERVLVLVSFREIFDRRITFDAIRITRPKVSLEISRDGEANWKFGRGRDIKAAKGSSEWLNVEIERLRLVRADISFKDQQNGRAYDFNTPDTLFIAPEGRPIELESLFKLNDVAYRLNASGRAGDDGALHFDGTLEFAGARAEAKNAVLKNKRLLVPKFSLKYKTAEVNGSGSADFRRSKPALYASFETPLFDIPNLFVPGWEEEYFYNIANGIDAPDEPSNINENTKAFGDVYLPIDEFDYADGSVSVKIGRLKAMPDMPIDNINARLSVKNGRGLLRLFADYMGGQVGVDVNADNRNRMFNADASINVQGVDVGRIVDASGAPHFFKGGISNAEIYARGRGKDLAEYMAGLSGYAKIWTTSGMDGYRIEKLMHAEDLVSSALRLALGRAAAKDESKITCVVANLNVRDGKVRSNRGIAVETKDANIVLSGDIDFASEQMDVSIASAVKEGFRVSDGVTKLIRIKGPMAYPNIVPDSEGITSTVGTTAVGAAAVGIATGGIGLAAAGMGAGINLIARSLLGMVADDPRPCMTAFDGADPAEYAGQGALKADIDRAVREWK